MKERIFKYRVTDEPVPMPLGAQILHVGKNPEDGKPAVWAKVDADEERIAARILQIVPTGCAPPTGSTYIGTAECGAYIWHIFEGGKQ